MYQWPSFEPATQKNTRHKPFSTNTTLPQPSFLSVAHLRYYKITPNSDLQISSFNAIPFFFNAAPQILQPAKLNEANMMET